MTRTGSFRAPRRDVHIHSGSSKDKHGMPNSSRSCGEVAAIPESRHCDGREGTGRPEKAGDLNIDRGAGRVECERGLSMWLVCGKSARRKRIYIRLLEVTRNNPCVSATGIDTESPPGRNWQSQQSTAEQSKTAVDDCQAVGGPSNAPKILPSLARDVGTLRCQLWRVWRWRVGGINCEHG